MNVTSINERIKKKHVNLVCKKKVLSWENSPQKIHKRMSESETIYVFGDEESQKKNMFPNRTFKLPKLKNADIFLINYIN